MKRRYLYALMFAVPTLMLATLFVLVVTAGIAGMLWIFVYGDTPWPSFVNDYSPPIIVAVLGAVWLALLSAVVQWGKGHETDATFKMKHAYFAAGIAAALVIVFVSHQRTVENIGPQPDFDVCSDFCTANTFSASRLPKDGTCRCLDANGTEALNMSISRIRSQGKE